MIQSLLLRSWHISLKNVSLCYCRHLSSNLTRRNTLTHCLHSSSYQNLSKKLSDSVRLNIGSVRLFLTHKHVPTKKVARLANKDQIPETYELIYSTPPLGVKLGYWCVIFMSGLLPVLAFKTFIEERDKPIELTVGAFDNEGLLMLQQDQIPYILGGLVVFTIALWALISRLPYRIYRSASEHNRHYIAVFLNRLWPLANHNHQFSSGRKVKFNFFTRYIFYMETYQLGSRRAALFPTFFRSAYDHDEMIDFQLGKSYFNVQEFNKEFDEKEKILDRKKKSK